MAVTVMARLLCRASPLSPRGEPMPSRGRDLARRHLPPVVRRAAIRVTGGRLAADGSSSDAGRSKEKKPAATSSEATTGIVQVLRRGGSLAEAVTAQVREDVAGGRAAAALAVATSLQRNPQTADVGDLAAGVVAFQRGFPQVAWAHLSRLPVELWSAHAPEEYVRAGLAVEPEGTVSAVRELVSAEPAYVDAAGWLAMLGPVFGLGDLDLARTLFDAFDRSLEQTDRPDLALVVNRDWLRPWVAASPDDSSAPPVRDAVSFAIMDYGHPGRARASANIGDHVQSLASLGHLVRHQKL